MMGGLPEPARLEAREAVESFPHCHSPRIANEPIRTGENASQH